MLETEKKAGPANAIEAANRLLLDVLKEKGVSYDQLVLAI